MLDKSIFADNCKVVLLGETEVGKTSIINQFGYNTFSSDSISTLGATFISKELKIGSEIVKMEIWDTAGQERFRALTQMFYREASAAILVYDITREKSFDELKSYWLKEVKENSPLNLILALAANKSDLYEDEAVAEEVGRKIAEDNNAIFVCVSAKIGPSIQELFSLVAEEYLKAKRKLRDCSFDQINSEKILIVDSLNTFENDMTMSKKKCC